MGGFIIIIIFVVIGVYTSIKSQKNREIIQKKFGENFPFPPLDEEQDQEQTTESYRFDDTPIERAAADEIPTDVVEPTTTPYKPIPIDRFADNSAPENKPKIKFDLRQAVIYSEILKPKYNDNIL